MGGEGGGRRWRGEREERVGEYEEGGRVRGRGGGEGVRGVRE